MAALAASDTLVLYQDQEYQGGGRGAQTNLRAAEHFSICKYCRVVHSVLLEGKHENILVGEVE